MGEQAAKEWLCRPSEIECDRCPSAGLGDNWRFGENDMVGAALIVDGASMHLTAFPIRDEGRRGLGPQTLCGLDRDGDAGNLGR